MPRTIAEEWNDFRTNVIPPNAPQIQVKESKRVFYAAFLTYLDLVGKVAEEMSEEEGVKVLEGYMEECRAFSEEVMKGNA